MRGRKKIWRNDYRASVQEMGGGARKGWWQSRRVEIGQSGGGMKAGGLEKKEKTGAPMKTRVGIALHFGGIGGAETHANTHGRKRSARGPTAPSSKGQHTKTNADLASEQPHTTTIPP